jgi:anti-sigma factor ChrR (cupin superfamily)
MSSTPPDDRQHAALNADARDRAELWALGLLPAAEADAYRAHLARCAACRSEVRELRAVLAGVERAAGERAPAADHLERVLARVRAGGDATGAARSNGAHAEGRAATDPDPEPDADTGVQTWRRWSADVEDPAGFAFVPGDAADAGAGWEPTSIAGIAVRRLFVDERADRITMLVRMAPHTAYPPHVHAGPEECYVLAGSLDVDDDLHMVAGDFQRAAAGSRHPVQSTTDGCLLLITGSQHDRLVDEPAG